MGGELTMMRNRFLNLYPVAFLTITLVSLSIAGSPVINTGTATAGNPVITIDNPVTGQALNDTTVIISGLTDPTVSVSVYLNEGLTGSTVSDVNGGWTYTASGLTEGSHSVYAIATDSEGHIGQSNPVTFEIDTVLSEIRITSPSDGAYVNLPLIEGQTEPEASVTVFIYGKQINIIADMLGYWSCLDESLPEGSHNVYASAVDKAGNSGNSLPGSFVLDISRPVVLPEIFPPDDMSQVPLDVSPKVYLVENMSMNMEVFQTAILLKESAADVNEHVYGTVYSTVYDSVYGMQYFEIVFKPDLPLRPFTKYTVSVNPALADLAGNYVHPRSWVFKTTGNTINDNPHGNYTNNVNTCVNCHTPHRAAANKLNRPPDQIYTVIDDYCNACHDGTAAPIPDKWISSHNHNFQMSIEGTVGSSACAGCHNPHLAISKENPNLLMDYYYYKHSDPTNPYLPDSSEQALCESCHHPEIKNDSRVMYIKYQYEKWHTASGIVSDYSLCLRCHDGTNSTDIAVFYNSPSRHLIRALDGSNLEGNLPCAECHNTHGADNLMLLKEELGHNRKQVFQPASDVWDPATERMFCTGCHNNSTELYGIVAGFVYDIPGHEASSTEYCSTCHGGSPKAAAHAPQ